MLLTIQCPHCSGNASCDDSELGQDATCPHCGQIFTLISPAQAAKAAKAPPPPVQVQVPSTNALAGAAPPPSPIPTASIPSARKPKETRAEFITRVRKESSYRTARGLVGLGCGLLGALGVGGIASGVAAFFGVGVDAGLSFVTGIIGVVSGFCVIVAAYGIYEASVVIFDIADTLIDERVHP